MTYKTGKNHQYFTWNCSCRLVSSSTGPFSSQRITNISFFVRASIGKKLKDLGIIDEMKQKKKP